MYLLVRFLKDNKFDIVSEKDVMNFNLDKYKLNCNRKYKVKWVDGKIYETVVTHVAATKELLEKKMEENGRRLYTVKGLVSNTETDDDDELFSVKKKGVLNKQGIKKVSPCKISTPTSNQIPSKSISTKKKPENNPVIVTTGIKPISTSSNINNTSPEPTLTPSVITSPIRNRRYRSKSQSPLTDREVINNLKEEISQLKIMYEELKIEHSIVKDLNLKLQDKILSKFENANLTDLIQPQIPLLPRQVGTAYGDQVFLGYETYIDKGKFDYVLAHSKSGQAFVKNLAVAVYGTEVLITSSVTGQACKNKKGSVAKPALGALKLNAIKEAYKFYLIKTGTSEFIIDLEVQKVSVYIARKIVDVARVPRKKHEKNLAEVNAQEDGVEDPGEVHLGIEDQEDDNRIEDPDDLLD